MSKRSSTNYQATSNLNLAEEKSPFEEIYLRKLVATTATTEHRAVPHAKWIVECGPLNLERK